MKTIILAVMLILFALVMPLCACTPATPPSPTAQPTGAQAAQAITPSAPQPGASVELSVVWTGWPEEQVKPIMDAFTKAYPNVTLKVERLPLAEIVPALEVRLGARNELPDIYMVDGPLTGSYAVRGHLLEVGPVLGDDLKNFTQAAIDQGSFNGKLWSVPYATSEQLLFYNIDLLKAAGIEPPPPDPAKRWTWEQVVDAARKINNPDKGIWGLIIEQPDRPYQILPLPQSKGAQVLSADGLKATGYVDSPKFIEAIEFYKKLFVDWKISPVGIDSTKAPEFMGTGKVAFYVGGTMTIPTFKRYPDLKYGVAPHPYFQGGKPVTPTGSWHVGINPRSKYLEICKTFVKFITRDDMMKLFFDLRGYPPVKKTVYAANPDVFNTDLWRLVQYELQNTAVPRPATPGYREYEDILRQALADIQQGADVTATLTKAAAKIDRELEKYK